MNEIEIDYSSVQTVDKVIDEEWEAPSHKYFGRKLENGKTEKEAAYVHQEYPRLVYSKPKDKIIAKVINSENELKSLGAGWEKNASAFGYLSAPSFDQLNTKTA